MKVNFANWWNMTVQVGQALGQWEEFNEECQKLFVQQYSVRRSSDSLRGLVQTGSVTSYLSLLRNIVTTIPGII